MSFDLFAYRELKDVVPDCEDRYDMIERNLVQPKERGRYWEKQSPDFLNQMEGYLMELEDSLMDIRDFYVSKLRDQSIPDPAFVLYPVSGDSVTVPDGCSAGICG